MNKITLKTVLKNFFYGIAKSFEKKRFWKSLCGSLFSAFLSAVITAFLLPEYFSKNNTANQLCSALFFFLIISGVYKAASDIKRRGFLKRLGRTFRKVFVKPKIIQGIVLVAASAGSFFLPPLLALALGISLFGSVVLEENSFLLMLSQLFKKAKQYGTEKAAEVRGRNLATAGIGVLFGCLAAVLAGLLVPDSTKEGDPVPPDVISDTVAEHSVSAENINVSGALDTADIYTSDAPFIQTHTPDEVPFHPMDTEYFYPQDGGDDYLITSFDGGKSYTLWVYDEVGDLMEVRGKKIFSSEEELREEYPDAGAGEYSEEGYLCADEILYYLMPEDRIAFVTQGNDKYAMLYRASQGWFDEGFYRFSKPYNPIGYEDAVQSEAGARDEPDDVLEDTYTESNSVEESVLALFSNICTMAGGDYEAYCDLFRNVDQNIIDQYYNMQYRDITQFEHALPIIIAQNGNYAYATVVFYTVPPVYPDTDMDTYMISTIVGCDENGEWRIEYNEETLSLLQDDYLRAIHTDGGYEARMSGMPYAKYWLSFNNDYAVIFEGAFVSRVIEMYQLSYGDVVVTLYFANGTDQTVAVEGIEELCITDGDMVFTDVSADMESVLKPGEGLIYGLTIPYDYVAGYGWNQPVVSDFRIVTEAQ